MKQTKFLLAFCILFALNSKAQTCIVQVESLKGTYEGECVKGKADGQGKAVGIDSYEGGFKYGYPEGKGTYVWQNGHYFVGNFKKGLKEGAGQMVYESSTGGDSIIAGYWKRDKYAGEFEKAFEVKSMTGRISRVNCRLSDKNGKDIILTVTKIGDVVSINQIVPVTGAFYNQNTQVMTNLSITRVQDVTFPFRAIFTFQNGETTEIIFNEKASYDVEIQLL